MVNYAGCAVGLLVVSVVCTEIEGSIGFPKGFAGLLIQADYVLNVIAVEMYDQSIVVRNGRSCGSSPVIALEVSPFPEFFSGGGVERCGAMSSEM